MTLTAVRPVVDEPEPPRPPQRSVRRAVGSWRVAIRLARREVRRRWGRTIIVVLLIATPVAAMVVANIDYRTDRAPFDNHRAVGAADARIDFQEAAVPPAGVDFRTKVDGSLPAGTEREWFRRAGLPLRLVDGPDDLVFANVSDIDLGAPLASGIVDPGTGRFPTADDEVWLSHSVARSFGVGLGAVIHLAHPAQQFRVVGIGGPDDDDVDGVDLDAPGFDFGSLRYSAGQGVLVGGAEWSANADVSFHRVLAETGIVDSYVDVQPPAVAPPLGQLTLPFIEVGPTPDGELARGWLYGTLAMSVLGIIVAAAFAVSGRRQLVAVGQLSAQGATSATIGRSLALQGSVSGLAGAAVGLAAGRIIWSRLASTTAESRHAVVSARDFAVIGASAVVVATVAAFVPSRALTRISVLTALGGRRPVAAVPRRLLPIGLAATLGGSTLIVVAILSDRRGSGDGAVIMTGALGAAATLTGVCLLCPLIIDRVANRLVLRPGAVRLAARSLGRHRARSASLLAAIIATGAAATVMGTNTERHIDEFRRQHPGLPANVALIESEPVVDGDVGLTPAQSAAIDPSAAPALADPTVRQRIESIGTNVRWVPTRLALDADTYIAATYGAPAYLQGPPVPVTSPDQFKVVDLSTGRALDDSAYVASDDLLDVLQLDATARALLLQQGAIYLDSKRQWLTDPGTLEMTPIEPALHLPASAAPVPIADVLPTGRNFGTDFVLMTSETVRRLGLDVVDGPAFAVSSTDFTTRQRGALYDTGLSRRQTESNAFRDVARPDRSLVIDIGSKSPRDHATRDRVLVLTGALTLVLLVVGFGLALWAAEGRDEQRMLRAIGASPRTLRRMTTWRSLILSATGLVLSVPLGYGTFWAMSSIDVTDTHAPFPWLIVGAMVIGVPIVVSAVADLSARFSRVRG